MTDTPPDPLAALLHNELDDLLCWTPLGDHDMKPEYWDALASRFRAVGVALDARPSGDEALRAALIAEVAALPAWDKRTVPGGMHVKRADVIRLIARAALAPVSPSPKKVHCPDCRCVDAPGAPGWSPDVPHDAATCEACLGGFTFAGKRGHIISETPDHHIPAVRRETPHA